MERYVVVRSKGHDEYGLITLQKWDDRDPLYTNDVDGEPMLMAAMFEANSWDDAKKVYEAVLEARSAMEEK